jgi:hypothetical protein
MLNTSAGELEEEVEEEGKGEAEKHTVPFS